MCGVSTSRWVCRGQRRGAKVVLLVWEVGVLAVCGCDRGGRGGGDRGQGSLQPPGDFLGGDLTYVTPDGAVETRFDERLRPVQFTGSGLTARLSWSDDARSAEVTVETADGSADVMLETDFSDAALLEALDRTEAETGLDAGPLRQWIAENPGRVERIAAGEEPAPALSDKRAVAFQTYSSREADIYISRLANAVLKVTEAADRLQAQLLITHPPAESPLWELYSIARATEASLNQFYRDQAAACSLPCTLACPVSCVDPDLGACCGQTDEAPLCDYTGREHCTGVFWAGFTCNEVVCDFGACCLDSGECADVAVEEDCDNFAGERGAEGYTFTSGHRCADVRCSALSACCLDGGQCSNVSDRPACDNLLHASGAAFSQFSEGETCGQVQAEGLCNSGVCCWSDGAYNCDYRDEESCRAADIDDPDRTAEFVQGAVCRPGENPCAD